MNLKDGKMDIKKTLEERTSIYGNFEQTGYLVQELKNCIRIKTGWGETTHPQREAIEMIFHKIGRIISGDPFYIENWRDICGYSQLIVEQLKKSPNSTDSKVVIFTPTEKEE